MKVYSLTTHEQIEQLAEQFPHRLIVIDFWATWCGPCKALAPIIEEIANEQEGKLKVGKLEVDQNPKAAGQYNIMSIPTIGVFVKGELKQQMVGMQSKEKIMKAVEEAKK